MRGARRSQDEGEGWRLACRALAQHAISRFPKLFSISETYFLASSRAVMMIALSRLTEGVFRRIGLKLGVGSGARGQRPIPFALGRPRDPPLGTTTRLDAWGQEQRARESDGPSRRRGEAPRGERASVIGARNA